MINWKEAFKRTFPVSSEVVIEDSEGYFIWGRIKEIKDYGIRVRGNMYQSKGQDIDSSEIFLEWVDITFIANDGFPVREIADMSYDQAIELCEKTDTDKMREFLMSLKVSKQFEAGEYCKTCFKNTDGDIQASIEDWNIFSSTCSYCRRGGWEGRSFGGGCPFVFEDVQVIDIINYGNDDPELWGEENEETLILRSVDGAIMHSFDMNHLFELR